MKMLRKLWIVSCSMMLGAASSAFAQPPVVPPPPDESKQAPLTAPWMRASDGLPPVDLTGLPITTKADKPEIPKLPDFRGGGVDVLRTTPRSALPIPPSPVQTSAVVPSVPPRWSGLETGPAPAAVAPPPVVTPPIPQEPARVAAPVVPLVPPRSSVLETCPVPAAVVPPPTPQEPARVAAPVVPLMPPRLSVLETCPVPAVVPPPIVTQPAPQEPARVAAPTVRSGVEIVDKSGSASPPASHGSVQQVAQMSAPAQVQPLLSAELRQMIFLLARAPYAEQREMAAHNLTEADRRSSPAIVEALIAAAQSDPAPNVRAASVRALARMHDHSAPVLDLVQSLRSDADPVVRTEAERTQRLLAQR